MYSFGCTYNLGEDKAIIVHTTLHVLFTHFDNHYDIYLLFVCLLFIIYHHHHHL